VCPRVLLLKTANKGWLPCSWKEISARLYENTPSCKVWNRTPKYLTPCALQVCTKNKAFSRALVPIEADSKEKTWILVVQLNYRLRLC
jgi:hypothetical protein